MEEYDHNVEAAIETETKREIRKVNKEIKGHITFNDKEYSKHFATAVEKKLYGWEATWYVKPPHFRLTHLLEKGHAKRGGGRTRAFPHIKYGADLAEQNYLEDIAKAIEKIK